ncbi:MAG: UDP-N-acetylmuramoyl-L-alanyl-D-glutamate--2,6-diaminopimelate ligase [Caldimicrobium sp.]
MLLRDLIAGKEIVEKFLYDESIEILGLTDDSRRVEPGFIFFARRGTRENGERFIPEAISKGAVCIIRETPPEPSFKCPQLQVRDLKKVMGELALKFFGNPEKELRLIGITGTNGKSSTSFFLKTLLENLGLKTGYVGTLFYEIDKKKYPAKETTPSILDMASFLKEAKEAEVKYFVMEVSSHALDQDRLYPLKFDLSAFTNLSRDHLDYHSDMEAYYLAKKKLFTHYLKPEGFAVISLESSYGHRLYQELRKEGVLAPERIFLVNNATIRVEILERTPFLKLKVKGIKREYLVETKLLGDYQALNLGTLMGCALALGLDEEEVILALKDLKNPPGRLELCGAYRGAYIFVDYAHTPEALESALKSLLPLKKGRLIVLFGCGGNRDPGKRPLMGRIASQFSDLVILTSDNPRFEDPEKIIEEIKLGLNGAKPYYAIPDRREAIAFTIKELREGDLLLIAGKGHEDYQEIKGKRYPFSDKEEVEKILRNLSKYAG